MPKKVKELTPGEIGLVVKKCNNCEITCLRCKYSFSKRYKGASMIFDCVYDLDKLLIDYFESIEEAIELLTELGEEEVGD